ncbi:MAG: BglG family transcription antiterminator [Anaerorhabdus sp.]
MQLNTRQREMVLQLVEMKNLSVKSLSELYGISKRMVYSDIQIIKSWCDFHKIEYDETSILPFIKLKYKKRVNQELKNVLPYLTKLSQRTRINLSLNYILFATENITIENLSEKLGISRSTLYRDLELIKAWTNQFNLKLSVNKYDGISIVASEIDYQNSIVAFLMEVMSQIDLFGLLLVNNPNKYTLSFETEIIYQTLIDYFDSIMIKDVYQHLEYLQTLQSYSFKESHKARYALQSLILIKRSALKFNIDMNLNYSEDLTFEKSVINKSFSKYQLRDSDVDYLAACMNKLILLHRSNFSKNEYVDTKITQLIEGISFNLSYPFQRDVELMENLRIHIYATLDRLKLNYHEYNAIKDEIKENYHELFSLVKSEILRINIFGQEVSDDEISYIVIYFATAFEKNTRNPNVFVVCTTGKGSAILLLSKMRKKMPYLNIVDSINIDSALKIGKNDAEAIISTTDFYHPTLPVIIVTPLLLDSEIDKINKSLNVVSTKVVSVKKEVVQDYDFIEYMQLLSDCVNAVKSLEAKFNELEKDVFIAVVIHLMMQCSKQKEDYTDVLGKLSKTSQLIYDSLFDLYDLYNKKVSEYDLKSIELYFDMVYEN